MCSSKLRKVEYVCMCVCFFYLDELNGDIPSKGDLLENELLTVLVVHL